MLKILVPGQQMWDLNSDCFPPRPWAPPQHRGAGRRVGRGRGPAELPKSCVDGSWLSSKKGFFFFLVHLVALLLTNSRGQYANTVPMGNVCPKHQQTGFLESPLGYCSVNVPDSSVDTCSLMYFSIPESFFPSRLASETLFFREGVLRHDLSEH